MKRHLDADGEVRRRGLAERVMEELDTATGLLGVDDRELCRRAGYNGQYLANRRAELKTKVGPPTDQGASLITLRFLADVEAEFGVKFEIRAIMESKS